jgi:hypothetical protein
LFEIQEKRSGVKDANFTFRVVFNSNFLNAAIYCIYPGSFGDDSISSWFNNNGCTYNDWWLFRMKKIRGYLLNDF